MRLVVILKIWSVSCLTIILFLFFSCNSDDKDKDLLYLDSLDNILADKPEAALDNLMKIDIRDLSQYNKAYFTLLQTIALDKTFHDFTSDSAINHSVKTFSYYRVHHPRQYARALMYQGLVRYRMGTINNNAYQPIKDAVTILESLPCKDLHNLYLGYYYLGILNYKNNNLQISDAYFKHALNIAEKIQNKNYIFTINWNFFWNAIRASKYAQAKIYLDV
ncbi:MAG: hypothetical protein QM751_04510 [Paludibacteraceae bacterium]